MPKRIKRFFEQFPVKYNFVDKLLRVGKNGGVAFPKPRDSNGKDLEVMVVASKAVDGKQRITLRPKHRTRTGTKISLAPDGDAPSAHLDTITPDFDEESERVMAELRIRQVIKPG